MKTVETLAALARAAAGLIAVTVIVVVLYLLTTVLPAVVESGIWKEWIL